MIRSLIVTGPTASGKTRLAVALAREYGGEIVSADSRQVFRGLDIGTGKDLCEYSEGGAPVPYHLIDVASPMEDFHLFKYLELAGKALEGIAVRGRLPVIAGGTPLYIKALLDGYDQEGGAPDEALRKELEGSPLPKLVEMLRNEAPEALFARTDLTQARRVVRALELARNSRSIASAPIIGDHLILAPFFTRSEMHKRIASRLDARLKGGLLDEARRLHDGGMSLAKMDWLGLEYRFAAKVISGEMNIARMRDGLLAHIRQFCKRQDGWFRKLEREGKTIYWLPDGDYGQASRLVKLWLEGSPLPEPEIRISEIRYTIEKGKR